MIQCTGNQLDAKKMYGSCTVFSLLRYISTKVLSVLSENDLSDFVTIREAGTEQKWLTGVRAADIWQAQCYAAMFRKLSNTCELQKHLHRTSTGTMILGVVTRLSSVSTLPCSIL